MWTRKERATCRQIVDHIVSCLDILETIQDLGGPRSCAYNLTGRLLLKAMESLPDDLGETYPSSS